jgi:ornithine cyclodeaminase/alanine dehydrogenase-like protein (mu-crystallin family)
MNAPPVMLLSRTAISTLATPRDYLEAMEQAFAALAAGRFEVPPVAHVPGVGGMFHIKSAQRGGSPALAVVKVNGNFPENGVL